MSADDPNSSPFGEKPANGTPDPQNPFQLAGNAPAGVSPSPFEISASNPFAAPAEKEETAKKDESKDPAAEEEAARKAEEEKRQAKDPFGGPTPELPTDKSGFEMKGFSTETAPAPAAEDKAAAPAPAATPAPGGPLPSDETKQLVLRAIFGVDRELTHQEILQRARSLPGVKNIAPVGSEAAGALAKVRDLAGSIGISDPSDIVLSCSEGVFDFINAGKTTLAVVREGNYSAGVRETLIIIAQEIDKL